MCVMQFKLLKILQILFILTANILVVNIEFKTFNLKGKAHGD